MTKAIPSIRLETDHLYRMIQNMEVGEFLSYKELNESIRRDVQGEARGLLASARNKAINNDQIYTVTIYNEGIRRATQKEYLDVLRSNRKHIGKVTRKALKKSLCMPQEEWDALSPEEQTHYNMERSMAGALALASKDRTVEKLRPAVEQARRTISETNAYLAMLAEKNKE